MILKVIAAAIAMTAVTAHAAENEFFFQSKAGTSDVTARLGFLSSAIKAKGATAENKFSGISNTGIAYEYGLNDQFAIEGALQFTSIEDDSTPKNKVSGLQNPTVTLKGNSNMSAATLRYGLGVGLALQKGKIDGNESSAATGGFSFTPYVGADTEAMGGVAGARLSYAVLLERTLEVTGATEDSKIKEGNTLGLSAFYETKVTDVTFGGSLNYTSEAATKDQDGDELDKSNSTVGISAYSVIPFSGFSLIPRLDYDFSNSESDKYDVINLSVAGRFTF